MRSFFRNLTGAQATLLAATIGLIGVLITVVINQRNNVSLQPIPTITPRPTVVGTPISGADIAAAGGPGTLIEAYDISLVVDEVHAYTQAPTGVLPYPGYVYVLVATRLGNGSQRYILSSDFYMIDGFDNRYANQPAKVDLFFNLPSFSSAGAGKPESGWLAFELPEAAINNSLHLRLEPRPFRQSDPTVRIEVFFDSLVVETPF